MRDNYERARRLLRVHTPGRNMETVFGAALEALLEGLDPVRRHARRQARAACRRKNGSSASRRIPAAVRDAVWARDGGRCTFVGPDGLRCPAAEWLEIDHIRPFALGGPSDDPSNLRLQCAQHNRLLARRVFGDAAVPSKRPPTPRRHSL